MLRRQSVDGRRAGGEARLPRPEGAASDDRQHRRDERERGEHHQRHRQRDHRPQRLVGAQDGEPQRGGRDEDRRAGRGDGAADAAQSASHRLVAVGVTGELLAEARRDEEHVVRPGAEQHDGHDARRLPRDGQVELLREPGGDAAGKLEDEPHPEQRDRGHDRRPVDGDEQREHQRDGDEQQERVDLAEHPDDVDHEPARPAHGDLDARQVERRGPLADRVHRVGERLLGRLAREFDEDVEGGAVGRDEAGHRARRAHIGDVVRGVRPGHPGDEVVDGCERGLAEPGGLAEHDQRGCTPRRELVARQFVGERRLGVAGEEQRLLVLAHLVEARELREQHARGEHPHKQCDPLAARAADEVGEGPKHGLHGLGHSDRGHHLRYRRRRAQVRAPRRSRECWIEATGGPARRGTARIRIEARRRAGFGKVA